MYTEALKLTDLSCKSTATGIKLLVFKINADEMHSIYLALN